MLLLLSVLLGIFILILLLLLAHLRITLLYKDGIPSLYIQVGPIRYAFPLDKKPRYRSLAKRLRKKKLADMQKKQKPMKKKTPGVLDELRGNLSVPEFLGKIRDILHHLAGRYAKKLRVTAAQLHITVGTGDPASTGIAYGITAQSVAYLLEFLDNTVTLTPIKKDAVQVQADFAGSWKADIEVTAGIRTLHLLQAILSAFFLLKDTPQANARS